MPDAYLWLKLLHVAAAIVAVGANVTYGVWIALAGRDRERLLWSIAGIRRLDRYVANPAYALLLLTGIAMVLSGGLSFTTFWIAAAILLYAVTAVVGIALYAPAVRQQLAAAEADPTSAAYAAAARRSNLLGTTTIVIVGVIVALMVLKPG
jgi:uncharacterized membrane protein